MSEQQQPQAETPQTPQPIKKESSKKIIIGVIIGSVVLLIALICLVIAVVMAPPPAPRFVSKEQNDQSQRYNARNSYEGIQLRAKSSQSLSNANYLQKKAETYFVVDGAYPKTTESFAKYTESKLDDEYAEIIDTIPTSESDGAVHYRYCGSDGAQVLFFDAMTGNPLDCSAVYALNTKPC